MAPTAVTYVVAGVLQIKPQAYTDTTSLSFQIRGNAVSTKQMCNYKSKSAAPSIDNSPVSDDHFHIQKTECHILRECKQDPNHERSSAESHPNSGFFPSLNQVRRKLTDNPTHMEALPASDFCVWGGRGGKGREGPEPTQALLQILLQELWAQFLCLGRALSIQSNSLGLGFLDPWQHRGATGVSQRTWGHNGLF